MDCSIIPIKRRGEETGLTMISTCDFFYPLVDEPFLQGRIGACNVLSDMYALGVTQIDSVLMILASSLKIMNLEERDLVTRQMIEGFNFACNQAGVECTGGQSVFNPWPIIGGTAMAACNSDEFIMPVHAQIGDVIVLTKPLGTQIAVNLNEWRQEPKHENRWNSSLEVLSKEEVNQAYQTAVESMSRLNLNACRLMHKYKAHGATDITGFGILGHANNFALNQLERIDIEIHKLPIIKKMDVVDQIFPFFKLMKGFSAETSGGLFIALHKDDAEEFVKELERVDGQPAWIVGNVVQARGESNQARIVPDFDIIQI